MTKKKLKMFFDLAEELYGEEQKKSGMISPLPCCYAEREGELIIFSAWGLLSNRVKKAVDIEFRHYPGDKTLQGEQS